MMSTLSSKADGSVSVAAPVTILNAQPHLCLNSSKNSRGSGRSLGVGANFRPNSNALIWQSVSWWEDRLRTDDEFGLFSEGCC